MPEPPRVNAQEKPRDWTDRAWYVAIAVALLAAAINNPFVTIFVVVSSFGAGTLLGQRDAYAHDDWLDRREADRG